MRKPYWIGLTVAGALLAAASYPVLAHCGKCLGSAKEFLKAMQDGKVTLANAVNTAEGAGKGPAVAAIPHKHSDGALHIHVYTVEGDKMWVVMINSKDGTIAKVEEAKMIELAGAHDHKDKEKDEKHP